MTLAVRDDLVELDEDFISNVKNLISVCAGLVTVNEHSYIIGWIHYTLSKLGRIGFQIRRRIS